MDLITTQKQKLLQLVQSIQRHDLSKMIENSLVVKQKDEFTYTDDSSDDSCDDNCDDNCDDSVGDSNTMMSD